MMNNHIGATGSASATLGNLKTSKLTGSVSVAQARPESARPAHTRRATDLRPPWLRVVLFSLALTLHQSRDGIMLALALAAPPVVLLMETFGG